MSKKKEIKIIRKDKVISIIFKKGFWMPNDCVKIKVTIYKRGEKLNNFEKAIDNEFKDQFNCLMNIKSGEIDLGISDYDFELNEENITKNFLRREWLKIKGEFE